VVVNESLSNLQFGDFCFGAGGVDLEGEIVDLGHERGLGGIHLSKGVGALDGGLLRGEV
jgi:hypothetical protein